MKGSRADELQSIAQRCSSRAEFARHVRVLLQQGMPLNGMRTAIGLLRAYDEPVEPLRIAVLGSITVELLRSYWVAHCLANGFEADLYCGPFGQIWQELQNSSGLYRHRPHVTYLLLRWSDLLPRLNGPLNGLAQDERKRLLGDLESRVIDLLRAAQATVEGSIVLCVLPTLAGPGLGLYDAMSKGSERSFHSRLKATLADLLREQFPGCYYDDGDELAWTLGRVGLYDARLSHTSRFPFSHQGANLLVQRLVRFPVLTYQPKLKCIVLDCDGTLWGGIVGEDGLQGIQLGADYPGSCYVEFQRRILDYLQRGLVLALCSKNNFADCEHVLREHPHMLLREQHFAAMQINWQPKPDNMRALSRELNIGLDSMLFVDDSPHECTMMHRTLPQVRVHEVPKTPLEVPSCLDHLQELEVLSLTDEDRHRPAMYVQNRQRRERAVRSRDVGAYLASLEMRMRIWVNGAEHASRLAQLTQKTNQFNLTTRRYSQGDIERLVEDPGWLVAYFDLEDVFGHDGIVGLMLVSGLTSQTAEVDTFLVSCRVLGRSAEDVFLHRVLGRLREAGTHSVLGRYIPTARNGLVRDFWRKHGFTSAGDGLYEYSLDHLEEEHPALKYFRIEMQTESR